RSRDYRIGGNEFGGNRMILNARNTTGLDTLAAISRPSPPAFLGNLRRPSPTLAGRDRSAIIVDYWAPYDWAPPKLWPLHSTREVLGRGATPRGLPSLDMMWYRPPPAYAFLPQGNWSLTATGTVNLEPGTYSILTISDDAVRVWLDSALVIDAWTPHESQVDY